MGWIEKFGHGGDTQTAIEVFGLQTSEVLDFSANINPLGPPEHVLQILRQELERIVHYPDPSHRAFRRKLAEKLGVDSEWLMVGNGAAECMSLVLHGLTPARVGVVRPCFSEYEQLANQFQAEVRACYAREENQWKPNLAELRGLFRETDLVFVGHPNNPTGTVYDLTELQMLGCLAEETDTYLIVDEAFLDFLPENEQKTLLPTLANFPKVVLIRSMTKFYAIPGLRLGYAIAHPDLIRLLKAKQVSWSVNSLALAAGEACLQETDDYTAQTVRLVTEERHYLQQSILQQFGWQVLPGAANFLLIRLPEPLTATELQYQLGKKGVLIRDCSMYPGLSPQDFRIAVRTRQENDRLLTAIKEVLQIQERGQPK